MRHFAITGIVTASWIARIISGSDMRATPPSTRMSAGTRSSAMTATAPASSATLAWSGVTTSMMTPPFSISARPRFTRKVPVSWVLGSLDMGPSLRATPGPLRSGLGPDLQLPEQVDPVGEGRVGGEAVAVHGHGRGGVPERLERPGTAGDAGGTLPDPLERGDRPGRVLGGLRRGH